MEIKRDIAPILKDHLDRKEITLIVGARQAGKTTLMKELKNVIDSRGDKSLFLSLDLSDDRTHFESQSGLLAKIRLELGVQDSGRGYIFIDEIQRRQDAGVFLKGIYDLDLPYKFIVTGSGSLELKEKIHESLAGRKREFEISTCSFTEFLNYRTGYRYENRLDEFFCVEKKAIAAVMLEYLNFGGYPRVVLEEKANDKRAAIDEIFSSYIDRDIVGFLNIDKKESYANMIRLLSSNIGGLVNHSRISAMLSIAQPTLKDYLWYAEKTFIVRKIPPFFKNATKEISKAPQFYFQDLGMRNFVAGLFGHIMAPYEHGFLFQNFVFTILREALRGTGAKLHFWRSKDHAEVDFVIDYGKTPVPVEVKCQNLKNPDIAPSLRSFIEKHKPSEAYVVNLSLDESRIIKETDVHFIPWQNLSGAIQALVNIPSATVLFSGIETSYPS